MRSIVFIIPAILALSCGSTRSEDNDISDEIIAETETVLNSAALYTLQNQQAGLFAIGTAENKINELALAYDNVTVAKIDLMTEGMPAPAIELSYGNSETVILQLSELDLTVCRIEIHAAVFKTEEGIGIGSTYKDLKSHYSFNGVEWGDDGDPLIIVEEIGLSFLLEPGDWWQMGDVTGDIPEETAISTVLIW